MGAEPHASQSTVQMPGLREWLDWLERDDYRWRGQAIKALTARHLKKVVCERDEMRDPPLTVHGMAYVAAAVAMVLTDREHVEHQRFVDGLRRELEAGA